MLLAPRPEVALAEENGGARMVGLESRVSREACSITQPLG